jgi:hypothetical protein
MFDAMALIISMRKSSITQCEPMRILCRKFGETLEQKNSRSNAAGSWRLNDVKS